jgi:pyridine nucleotide-disulfide oxidoreductase family protein
MTRVVLAGLGHAHLFVLDAMRTGRLGSCELVVCTGEADHTYSGMTPGWLGGRYQREELSLPVAPLVAAAGATLLPHHVVGVDPSARTVQLADGSSTPYDLCSIAVGSLPSGLDLPGVRAHSRALKPLSEVAAIIDAVETMARRGSGRVVVVGGGVAGVEVALGVVARAQLVSARARLDVTLIGRESEPARDRAPAARRLIMRALQRHGIAWRGEVTVHGVSAEAVQCANGDLSSELTIWATGASAPSWFAASGLATDARGFLAVNGALQSVGDARVFAAGDSAAMVDSAHVTKAGVYAVRMGPRLARALASAIADTPLDTDWTPQRRFLALLNTGDGRAIASWGPFAAEGHWAMAWKDRLDRQFLEQFDWGGGANR